MRERVTSWGAAAAILLAAAASAAAAPCQTMTRAKTISEVSDQELVATLVPASEHGTVKIDSQKRWHDCRGNAGVDFAPGSVLEVQVRGRLSVDDHLAHVLVRVGPEWILGRVRLDEGTLNAFATTTVQALIPGRMRRARWGADEVVFLNTGDAVPVDLGVQGAKLHGAGMLWEAYASRADQEYRYLGPVVERFNVGACRMAVDGEWKMTGDTLVTHELWYLPSRSTGKGVEAACQQVDSQGAKGKRAEIMAMEGTRAYRLTTHTFEVTFQRSTPRAGAHPR